MPYSNRKRSKRMKKNNYEIQTYTSFEKKNDCDVILDDVESLFGSIGNCFETAFDERKTKMQVMGSILSILKPTTKLLWDGTSCAVKNTPKAVTAIANVKRELTDTITEEYHEYQKELKEQALEEKIAQLKNNNTKGTHV